MKVFISQPTKGKTDEEILKEREQAIADIHFKFPNESVEIIDSFLVDSHKQMKPAECLGQSIELLGGADLAVFIGDWKNARGCSIEHLVCNEYGIKTLEV